MLGSSLLISIILTFQEPLEAHNKLKKFNRERHTMKHDRKQQMEQWIYRSVDGSDPLVLQESQVERVKLRSFKDYPQVVKDMVILDHPYNQVWLKHGQLD